MREVVVSRRLKSFKWGADIMKRNGIALGAKFKHCIKCRSVHNHAFQWGKRQTGRRISLEHLRKMQAGKSARRVANAKNIHLGNLLNAGIKKYQPRRRFFKVSDMRTITDV